MHILVLALTMALLPAGLITTSKNEGGTKYVGAGATIFWDNLSCYPCIQCLSFWRREPGYM